MIRRQFPELYRFAPSIVIGKDGSYYYALERRSKYPIKRTRNASYLIQSIIDDTDCGMIYFTPGQYDLYERVEIDRPVILRGELGNVVGQDVGTIFNLYMEGTDEEGDGLWITYSADLPTPRLRFPALSNIILRRKKVGRYSIFVHKSNIVLLDRVQVYNSVGGVYSEVCLYHCDAVFIRHCYFMKNYEIPTAVQRYIVYISVGLEYFFLDTHIATPGGLSEPPNGVYIGTGAKIVRFIGCEFDSLYYPIHVYHADSNVVTVACKFYNNVYNRPLVSVGKLFGTWIDYGTPDSPAFRPNKNGGKATFSGDGTTTQFTIPHNLPLTPSTVYVIPASPDARGNFHVTADSSNIYVNYETAPPSGTDNVELWWYAEVQFL